MDHCAACDAKDRHIETLQDSTRLLLEQNRALNDRLLELAAPGIGARLALQAGPRPTREKREHTTVGTHNPGRLAALRSALAARRAEAGTRPAGPRPEKVREDIERSFSSLDPDMPRQAPADTVEAE